MARILIHNGRIWDGEQFSYGDILTEGKYIARICEQIDDDSDFVYNAAGKIVSVGLVDAHVHIKGIASDRYGIQAEMSSFPFGVTAVNNAGSFQGNRTLLDSFAVKNTIFVCTKVENDHAHFNVTEEHMQRYGDKAIGIKLHFDSTNPEIRSITPLREVCDYARKKKLKVMVHCSNSPTSMLDIVHTLSAGDILTHVFHGGENTCMADDFEAFRVARKKGVILDAGFAGHVHTDFRVLENAIELGYLPDTISTDITCCSAYMRGGKYGMTMCMSIAKSAGMCEEDIFKAVTSTPAKVLGKENEWGTLQVGRTADIAVFDYVDEGFDLMDGAGNHIQSNRGYRCILTMADGQIIYKY